MLAGAADRDFPDGHLFRAVIHLRNVDGSTEMLESGNAQFYSRIL
jgi:hypothetical protein